MKQVFPKWLKVCLGLTFGFLGFVVLLVAITKSEQAKISSWEQWKQHRGYLESFSNDIMLKGSATRIYAKANDYYKDGFYNNCNVDSCAEYKAYVRAAKDAASDGILTPQELVDIAQYKVILDKGIIEKDAVFKKTFGR